MVQIFIPKILPEDAESLLDDLLELIELARRTSIFIEEYREQLKRDVLSRIFESFRENFSDFEKALENLKADIEEAFKKSMAWKNFFYKLLQTPLYDSDKKDSSLVKHDSMVLAMKESLRKF